MKRSRFPGTLGKQGPFSPRERRQLHRPFCVIRAAATTPSRCPSPMKPTGTLIDRHPIAMESESVHEAGH
jgi:hypothetical protein